LLIEAFVEAVVAESDASAVAVVAAADAVGVYDDRSS
jgi:hypothetical protein